MPNDIIARAERWLSCVDEYDRKTGKLIREREDPQTRLIRDLLKALKESK